MKTTESEEKYHAEAIYFLRDKNNRIIKEPVIERYYGTVSEIMKAIRKKRKELNKESDVRVHVNIAKDPDEVKIDL